MYSQKQLNDATLCQVVGSDSLGTTAATSATKLVRCCNEKGDDVKERGTASVGAYVNIIN